jgi:hypothetical protein
MNEAFNKYIKTIANCSYQALKEWDLGVEDYPKWLMRHHHYSGRINRAFIKAFKSSVKSWPKIKNRNIRRQDFIDLLYEILLDNLKYRTFLLKKNVRICSKKIFIITSFLRAYLFLALSLTKSFASMSKHYSFPNEINGDKLVIVKNFPSHAFTIKKNKNKSAYSFGCYLDEKLTATERKNIISIDEYTRPSFAKELCKSRNIAEMSSRKQCQIRRKVVKSRVSFHSMVGGIKSLVILLTQKNLPFRKSIDLLFLVTRRHCSSSAFLLFLKEIKQAGCSISKNYVIGFTHSYLYPINTYPSPKEFIYSVNLWNPPRLNAKSVFSHNDEMDKFKLDKVPLGLLTLSRSAVGFSNLPKEANLVKRLINRNFKAGLPTHKLKCEGLTPVQLGYETEIILNKINDHKNVIVIFDTPPDDRINQIKRSVFGDLTHDLSVNSEFLMDVVQISMACNFVILHKPKYSLKNYCLSYRKVITNFKMLYNKKYHLMSPYSNIIPILSNCSASISFLGSSTNEISRKFNKNSFTYIPDSIIVRGHKYNKSILLGRTQLLQKLKQIRK